MGAKINLLLTSDSLENVDKYLESFEGLKADREYIQDRSSFVYPYVGFSKHYDQIDLIVQATVLKVVKTMSETSFIKCELKFDEGLHRINFEGTTEECGYMSVLIINTLREKFLSIGFTDDEAKRMLIGGIERFWGDPAAGAKERTS